MGKKYIYETGYCTGWSWDSLKVQNLRGCQPHWREGLKKTPSVRKGMEYLPGLKKRFRECTRGITMMRSQYGGCWCVVNRNEGII